MENMELKEVALEKSGLKSGLRMSARAAGTGPAVVLIHGIPGSADVWHTVAGILQERYTVIVPDLIGFGRSSRSKDIGDLWRGPQAEGIITLMDSLDIGRFHVIAHDFGGPVASALLESHPDRIISMTIAATNFFPDTPIPFPLSGVLNRVFGGLWARMIFSPFTLKMMVKSGTGSRTAEKPETGRYVQDRGQAAAVRVIFSTALKEIDERYRPVMEAMRDCPVPSAVVWGDEDSFFSPEQGKRTAELMGTDDFRLISGAGHFLPDEAPQELAEAFESVAGRTKSAAK